MSKQLTKKKQSKTKTITIDDSKKPCAYSGSRNEDFSHMILNQGVRTAWFAHSDKEGQEKLTVANAVAMASVNPQDELEGMMATQMVGLHNAAMECLRRAMTESATFEGRDMNLKHAAKLSRAYTMMMEALDKRKGKNGHKMTVEHVHVHEGGQAIVGDVHHSKGGGNDKK